MTVIELTEYGASVSVPLDEVAARALVHSGVVDATPDPDTVGRWRLRAKNLVGVAAVHTGAGIAVTLRITPKVPIARLLFLLGYTRGQKGWRDETVGVAEEQDLPPAFARLFAAQAEQALRQGLLQGYREVEETSLVMRGSVRHAEQIRRHHGRLVPLEIAHDEYTTDVAENRMLRSACDVLLRLPGGIPADLRGRLLRLRLQLGEITPVPRGQSLPHWSPSRLNVRYHDALRLAGLVLRGASVEHRAGDVSVHGFLFDLAKVFDDFVTVALRDALAEHPGHGVLQARHHLDALDAIRIIPDYVRYAEDGTPLAVVDAKYKAERPEGFPDADLYQMLAYCTALNLAEGHLVYAKGWGEGSPHGSHRVRHAGIAIHQHTVDLDQPPSGLLAEIRLLADRLVDGTWDL